MAGLEKESGRKDVMGAASNRPFPELGFVSWRVDCFIATSKRTFPELGFKSEANFRLEAPTAR